MAKAKKRKANAAAMGVQSILGGYFLTRKKTTKNLPFLLFLAFLAIIYIANSYFAEKNIRRTEKLQRELKELRYEYLNTKSQMMQYSSQSKVANSLAKTGIKESTVPPEKIFVEKK